MDTKTPTSVLKPSDFASKQEVRWCPGCGDYAIIKAVRKTMAEVGAKPENTLVISGIGCSSRFPYYMSTYGFHSIHGRAPTLAAGAMLANPDLDVWIITGDGDGLAIGGNHFIHMLRRNFDCQILLFNNEIYGLTKGQCSPTSHMGTRTPSTPTGSIDAPLHPVQLALGSGARFVARAVDTQQKQLSEILTAAYHHKGTSFVEIFQNCIVYNDGVFDDFADKKKAPENQLAAVHGAPLIYGANKDKALQINSRYELETVAMEPEGQQAVTPIIHDETSRTLAFMLSEQMPPDGPMVTGILYQDPDESYQARVENLMQGTKKASNRTSLRDALHEGTTWRVE